MGVDQPRQHGAVAQVHEPIPRGHGPPRGDPLDATPDDEDVHVVLHTAAAVQDCRSPKDGARASGVLHCQRRDDGE